MIPILGLLLMADPTGLTTFLDDAVAKGDIPGAVVVVQKNGKTIFSKAAGYADLESKCAIRVDDIFMMASTSKPIAATAILTLVDQGKLSLDEKVQKYFPAFAGDSTVRQLLSHTSGIFGNNPEHPRLKQIRSFDQTLASAVSAIVKEPLAYEPGGRYSYGGASFCVAGRIAELITQEDFDHFVNRVLFKPLGMKDTVYRTSKDLSARIPKLYKRSAEQWMLTPTIVDTAERRGPRPDGFILVPGGIYSTAADLLRFAQMHLDGGGKTLSRGMIEEMRRKQTGTLKENYGLGWQLLPSGAFAHGGAYGTYLYVDPAHNAAAVILTQTTGAAKFQEAARKHIQQLLAHTD
jgi:CubicO group peptidase (beta-lactamase class C family)